ncbi:type II toxin-antitoxin system Phd/YefM family antitoxin [Treponema sp.]
MSQSWPLQDAKARFSELFSKVNDEGPQRVTRNGKHAIILMSELEYKKLKKQNPSFIDFLFSAPKANLDIERAKDFGRNIEL